MTFARFGREYSFHSQLTRRVNYCIDLPMKHLKALLVLTGLLSSMSASAARQYDTEFAYRQHGLMVDPTVQEMRAVKAACTSEAAQVKSKINTILDREGVSASEVSVVARFDGETSYGATGYSTVAYCDVSVWIVSDTKLDIVNEKEGRSYLGRHGFNEGNYATACDPIAAEFSSNPDEIVQSRKANWNPLRGYNCDVTSRSLAVKR